MIRVLIAKPGLDGHDKGAKAVAMALRDAGMEVIYTGRRQSVDMILNAAVAEAVDIIGLSILSGVHIEITEVLMQRMNEKNLTDIAVIIGGVIPKKDIPILESMGVKKVFPIGSTFKEIVGGIKEIVEE
jgi:methylmalonyl-CoA mutase C-terminal domain/subunit